MIVKFFKKPPGGGGVGSVKYLLNERVENETARVLEGDPQITTSIIESINRNDKATIGCISFEEQNIDESLKYKLMDDLEKTLFPGMDKSQYNILWVEHTDKKHLELNFVIPKEELTTNKLLTPYYHKQDLPRLENFEKLNNLKYNFSNPLDPQKARNIQDANTKEKLLYKTYEDLDLHLKEKVKAGELTNRDELISYVKSLNHEVTRTNDKGISIKMQDSQKARRFKDDMYCSKFVNLESINVMKVERAKASKEFKEDLQKNKDQKIQEYSKKLEDLNSYKALILSDKYSPSLTIEPKLIMQKVKEQHNDISRTVPKQTDNQPTYEREFEAEVRLLRERIENEIERTRSKRARRTRSNIEQIQARKRNFIERVSSKVRELKEQIVKIINQVKGHKMIAEGKEKEYEEKIKDYSENMLSYELSECETNLEAELMFGKSNAERRSPLPESIADIKAELKAGLKNLDGEQGTDTNLK